MRSKYAINPNVLDHYLGVQYKENSLDRNVAQPQFNALAICILLYYYGLSEKYNVQRTALVELIILRFEHTPKEKRRENSELVIILLDLLACPYIKHDDRLKMCEAMGIEEKQQTEMETYLKKRKYMFTRWTNVNLTKELGAKISLEVYS